VAITQVAIWKRGNTLFDKGEFAEAALNYQNAVRKEASNGEAYYRLGLAELKQNKAARPCVLGALEEMPHR